MRKSDEMTIGEMRPTLVDLDGSIKKTFKSAKIESQINNPIIEVSMNSYQSLQEQNQTLLRDQTGIYPEDFISCVKSNDAGKGSLINVIRWPAMACSMK